MIPSTEEMTATATTGTTLQHENTTSSDGIEPILGLSQSQQQIPLETQTTTFPLTGEMEQYMDGQDRRAAWWKAHSELRLQGYHAPASCQANCKNVESRKQVDRRKLCKVCYTKTSYICKNCGVFLCIKVKSIRGCWEIFHEDETWD
jgi:hypothetical protein